MALTLVSESFAGMVLSVSSEKVSGGGFFGDTKGSLHC